MRKLQALGGAAALLAALLLGGCSQTAVPATPEQAATAAPEATAEPAPAPSTNPLTGLDDGDYTGKRPVAVTLRTLDGAQPQWGVASADVLVEGVTEGSTAGLTAIFADVDSISKVGPVGAGRDLFLQVALPLNAVPVSIDKNIYASNLLNTLGYQDLDGYHIGKAAFAFDQGRQDAGYREENCWYTTGELIRTGLTNYGASAEGDNTPLFRFGTRPEVSPENRNGMNLTVTFSKTDSEQLNYNTGTGLYEKLNADGSPMTDADNGQQVGFTNVFVLYASSGIKDDGYIRQYDLPADTVTALQDALTPYCTDLNGDGKVVVQVNSYTVDFNAENDNTDAYNQMAGVTRLSADLSDSGTLYVMLIADPAGFQKSTGALAYLDGTPPEDDADDWQNMVYRWTDCPVLAGMDLGDYDGYTLLDDATDSNQSVLSTLYVGRRAVLDEEQAAHYADGEELWQTLTAGAVLTAAAE